MLNNISQLCNSKNEKRLFFLCDLKSLRIQRAPNSHRLCHKILFFLTKKAISFVLQHTVLNSDLLKEQFIEVNSIYNSVRAPSFGHKRKTSRIIPVRLITRSSSLSQLKTSASVAQTDLTVWYVLGKNSCA